MKRTINALLISFALLCVAATSISGDSPSTLREVLNRFRSRYNAVNDFKADMKQVHSKGSDHESVVMSTIIYKRPNRYRIEYTSPYSLIIKCDGHKKIIEAPATDEVLTEDIVEGSYDFLNVSARVAQLEKYYEVEVVGTQQYDGKTFLGVILRKKTSEDSKGGIRLLFNMADGLIYRYLYRTYGLDEGSGEVYFHTVMMEYQRIDDKYVVGKIIHSVFFYKEVDDQGQSSSEPVTVISETEYKNVEVNTGVSLREIIGE